MTYREKCVIWAAARVVNCSEGGCAKCLAGLKKAVKTLGKKAEPRTGEGS